ncbi:MAG: penicillin-binding protein activator [Thiolinea sp.]
MKKYKFHQTMLYGLLSSLLLLSGCVLTPQPEEITTPSPEAPAAKAPDITEPAKAAPVTNNTVIKAKPRKPVKPTITQANQLMKKGRRAQAADVYYRSSFSYPSPQRERIMLQAAEISASLGNQVKTGNYLKKVPKRSLTPLNQIRYNYIESLLALHNKQPNQALALLPRNSSRLPKGLRGKVELVRKNALAMGGKYPNQPSLAKAQQTPKKIVPTVPKVQFQQPPKQQPAPNNAANTNTQQHNKAQAQQNQNTGPRFVLPRSTNKIAVLLPDKGALGKVGDEIYQGVKDAQAAYGSEVLSRRYAVDKTNVISQYQQAMADGADIVVGPLDKDSLAALTTQPQLLRIPVLSLNYLPGSGNLPHTLYQFGLSPEDEARQIAEFALSRNQTSGVIMTPDSAWGKRLANAFAQTYQHRGGKILNAEFYPNSSPSAYLKRVQKLLEGAQGANMVFLAAAPTQARLLRPLLKDQAGILPVYATSHIYSGREASNKDIDLDGIVYTEIPYILKKSESGSLNNMKFPRLYALGMDAVAVAKNLAPLAQRQSLSGQTGQIRMDPQRRLQRQLEFATFINGQPHSLTQ